MELRKTDKIALNPDLEGFEERVATLALQIDGLKPRKGQIVEIPIDEIAGTYRGFVTVFTERRDTNTYFFRIGEDAVPDRVLKGQELPHLDRLEERLRYLDRSIRALPTAQTGEQRTAELAEMD